MPSPKNHRKGGHEKNKRGRLAEKASSFHGRAGDAAAEILPRPRTVPDLLDGRRPSCLLTDDMAALMRPVKLTKLLLNVTVQRSLGPVQVLISPEATVEDLIAAALSQYSKEVRRPVVPTLDPSAFNLHYSQFSLESLDRAEKLLELGSRNFFLCQNSAAISVVVADSSCSKEDERKGLKFMNFWR